MYGSHTPVRTPWGMSQSATAYGDGITFYSTSSHGGFNVSAERLREMPKALRTGRQWFEEDCEACLVILAFQDRFTPLQVDAARVSVRNNYPDAYAAWSGTPVTPAESHVLRRRAFNAETRDRFVVRAAWGDWHESVPAGKVGVLALCAATNEEAGFLVDAPTYDARGEFGFVVDTAAAEPWIAPGKTKTVEVLATPEAPFTAEHKREGQRVRYGDAIYRLRAPEKRSWIVERESDGHVFRLGPSHFPHCTIPPEQQAGQGGDARVEDAGAASAGDPAAAADARDEETRGCMVNQTFTF